MDSNNGSGDNPAGLEAFEVLGQFLEEDGWHPQLLERGDTYRMGFSGESGYTTCFAQILVDVEILLFYVVAPIRVPEGKRPQIAEFITRANYGLRIGNFEMDYSDGELRYKSSLDFQDTTLLPVLIQNAIYPAVQTMDRYLPGVMAIVYGDRAPADAVADIEGGLGGEAP